MVENSCGLPHKICRTRFSVRSLEEMKAFYFSWPGAFQDEGALETSAVNCHLHCSLLEHCYIFFESAVRKLRIWPNIVSFLSCDAFLKEPSIYQRDIATRVNCPHVLLFITWSKHCIKHDEQPFSLGKNRNCRRFWQNLKNTYLVQNKVRPDKFTVLSSASCSPVLPIFSHFLQPCRAKLHDHKITEV